MRAFTSIKTPCYAMNGVQLLVTWLSILCCTPGQPIYWVTPDSSSCPSNTTCHKLSHYTAQPSRYFTDNSVFKFLKGRHILQPNEHVVISGVQNITFQGTSDFETVSKNGFSGEQSSSVITCAARYNGNLNFINCLNVSVNQLTMQGCGGSSTQDNYTDAALVFNHIFGLNIDQITISDSVQYGLIVVSSINVSITRSWFHENAEKKRLNKITEDTIRDGGSVLIETRNITSFTDSMNFITIEHVNVTHSQSTGLGIIIQQTHYTVILTIACVKADSNRASNIAICVSTSRYRINITSVVSQNANKQRSKAPTNLKVNGAGFSFKQIEDESNGVIQGTLSIVNCSFLTNNANVGGGMLLYFAENTATSVTINSCRLLGNEASQAAGVYLLQQRAFQQIKQPVIHIHNLTISESVSIFDTSTFTINSVSNVLLTNINISDNNCTGLLVVNSRVFLDGFENLLNNNTGVLGGGLALYENSFLVFSSTAKLSLVNNHALKTGGAIYTESVKTSSLTSKAGCFLQFPNTSHTGLDQLYFANNTAQYAGSLLYGGDNCVSYGATTFRNATNTTSSLDVPVITSNPVRVHFCDNKGVQTMTISATPGELLLYPTIAVTSRWKTKTLARVHSYASVDNLIQHRSPSEAEFTIMLDRAVCTPLNFTFTTESDAESVDFFFDLDGNSLPLLGIPNQLTLKVYVKDCPTGFTLSNVTRKCDCSPDFIAHDRPLTCDITKQSFQHTPVAWFGEENCTYLPHKCPFDYCISNETVNFTLSTSDLQCRLNRSGVLCGGCTNGTSLILGSNRCKRCSNINLLLLVPFALVGLALIGLIMVLKLTVSMGTINGLIFFANTVHIYKHVFLSRHYIPVLTEFISWINLDLGIEFCFYDGMTSCGKTWLKLVFPAYLCMIVVTIIVIGQSHKRTRHVIGTAAVEALATILLLSYTQLVRFTALVLHGVRLNRVGCPSRLVWIVDGNYDYGDMCHISLIILTAFLLVFYLVPYTALLLVFPIIEQHTALLDKKWLRWLKFLKPLTDAYKAPFGRKKGFWPGVLLLVRIVFILVTILTEDYTLSFTVLECTCPALAIVLLRFRIFERDEFNFFNALLIQFMIPLLLSVTRRNGGASNFSFIVKVLVLSISFGAFLIILAYHIYLQLYRLCWLRKTKKQIIESSDDDDDNVVLIENITEEEGSGIQPSSYSPPSIENSNERSMIRKFTVLDGYPVQ